MNAMQTKGGTTGVNSVCLEPPREDRVVGRTSPECDPISQPFHKKRVIREHFVTLRTIELGTEWERH